jgi:tuberous sclerosis 2
LTSLLARDHSTYLNPLLSTTLLCVADHLTDADTAKLPAIMFEQHDLSPTSPEWLSNWANVMGNANLLSQARPLTRTAIMNALEAVYESVKDMPSYRRPLADLVFRFCQQQAVDEKDDSEGEVMWRILGEEVVLRTIDGQDGSLEEGSVVEQYITLLTMVAAGTNDDDDDDTASVYTSETHSPSPHTSFSTGPSNSPTLSRMQSEYPKDKDSNMPSVMALLSSLTTGPSSRSQSQQPYEREDQPPEGPSTPPIESTTLPRSVGAVIALIVIFSQLAFTPDALTEENLDLAVRIYDVFVTLMVEGRSSRARLTVLQFMMRTRADRDHRMYFVDAAYDPDGCLFTLASLIDRVIGAKESLRDLEPTGDPDFLRKARARLPQERDGRRASRGRGTRVSHSASSRSRSRATQHPFRAVSAPAAKPRDPIWHVPESLPFKVCDSDTPSDGLMSYDPVRGEHKHVLQLSNYLTALVMILDKETNWEILSYVLCHLPVQLTNKHLFCGPKCREVLARLLTTLCTGLINGELASEIDRWPQGLKARDAHGLAYHTVSVLISYRRSFDGRQQHLLVEVLQAGLNGQPSAIKCCLHGLSLAAFELQSSMKKCLSRILEKLSQIMSNPEMAVHILSFLAFVGSLRELHYNFTEGDFKMIFGVALQYLQHHNRPGSSPTISWALSQHLRILSYAIVYTWFLAVKLPDRPRHIPYITRQLLLANEGKEEVDEPTEVCFDWLARYTYASADPRPANSLLSEIVMNPTNPGRLEVAVTEKTWIVGNSFITIRVLARLGWIEILSRRPSGYTKFLCRVENVPMVGAGDVDPDMVSVPASLIIDRDTPDVEAPLADDVSGETVAQTTAESHLLEVSYLLYSPAFFQMLSLSGQCAGNFRDQ